MWYNYEKKAPRQTKGGIKAQSKRGDFAKSWWAKRWISALESFNDSSRLSRGRSYARNGQVLSIEISSGRVLASVQGSRSTPYRVTIEIDTLSSESWRQVANALSQQAFFAAKLLAKEMPQDIESVFYETKLSLMPTEHYQLKTDCSCPDWSNPCKHVAAVFYLIGEEFDRDPFLIFKLRGMDREAFLELLLKKTKAGCHTNIEQKKETEIEPLSSDLTAFWHGKSLPENFSAGELAIPSKDATLSKSLGKFPFWRGRENLQEVLESIYKNATTNTLQLLTYEKIKENQ